jgi:hypothetical protein
MSQEPLSALLGLDIGRINTRASLFGIVDGKYRLLGSQEASTSLGPGVHVGKGAGEAMSALQRESEHVFLKAEGGLVMPASADGLGIDQVALTTSAGPWIKTVLLGLSQSGSLAAGRALVNSLPLDLMACYGSEDLVQEPKIIESLLALRPELIILVGGEDGGAKEPLLRWVEILRLFCRLLSDRVKPVIVFAGNLAVEGDVRRRLESQTSLYIAPNIMPAQGEWDLTPAQNLLEREILRVWEDRLSGIQDLFKLSQSLKGSKSFSINRSARYLGKTVTAHRSESGDRGLLIADLGGGSTAVSVSLNGRTGTVMVEAERNLTATQDEGLIREIHRWTAAPVTLEETAQYLSTRALHPSTVPMTLRELALSQSVARYHLKHAMQKLFRVTPWMPCNLQGCCTDRFEPVIASGAPLTMAPTPGEAMMILLDGLQPCGITTMVLDRHHLLPLLAVVGEAQPVLPVHVMNSDAFENLGTVIAPISRAPQGEKILSVRVETDQGKTYSVDIEQGTIRRLLIPEDDSAVFELQPNRRTDIGFGGKGIDGRLKVTGGLLGVVIDARGRPLRLPEDDHDRVEQLRRWLWILGG